MNSQNHSCNNRSSIEKIKERILKNIDKEIFKLEKKTTKIKEQEHDLTERFKKEKK